jgi:hypothetical protein
MKKIVFLQSSRRDLMAQMRREIHTARSTCGIDREIRRIDKQLEALGEAEIEHSQWLVGAQLRDQKEIEPC